MTLKLRFPPESDLHCNRKEYTIHPKFTIPLGPGTIFILAPWDDLFFTHEAAFEAWFEAEDGSVGDSEWREAFVFRHLQSLLPFHDDLRHKHARVVTLELEELLKKRKRTRAKKAVRDRQQALRK
jgi:hypothetical protein